MEWLEGIVGNPTVVASFLIFMATTMFTVFARTIIGIFRLGTFFRAQYATKEDQKEFEKQVIVDLRAYKDELLKVIMAASMEVIREKLKDVETIEKTAQEMKSTEARLEVQIKSAMEKVEEVRGMSDNLRSLNSKVERLQYGQENIDVRRREK
jgi:hypothetical protein